jgi:hypothetical protein
MGILVAAVVDKPGEGEVEAMGSQKRLRVISAREKGKLIDSGSSLSGFSTDLELSNGRF